MSEHDYNFAASPYATETRADRVAQRIADAEAQEIADADETVRSMLEHALQRITVQGRTVIRPSVKNRYADLIDGVLSVIEDELGAEAARVTRETLP